MSEAESTAEKDDKAEKAGKKVAKDIEYDEGHKGKDDEKAEKAGEKVAKDIEYDDKKDKKSLKDWFEIIDKNMLTEADQLTIEPAKQNTQVIKQGTKTLGTVTNPQLAAQIKQSIGKGEMSLAGTEMKEAGAQDGMKKVARLSPDQKRDVIRQINSKYGKHKNSITHVYKSMGGDFLVSHDDPITGIEYRHKIDMVNKKPVISKKPIDAWASMTFEKGSGYLDGDDYEMKEANAQDGMKLPSYIKGESRFVKDAYKTLVKYGFIPDPEDQRTAQMGSFKNKAGHRATITWEGNIQLSVKQPNGKYKHLYVDNPKEMIAMAKQLNLAPISEMDYGGEDGPPHEGHGLAKGKPRGKDVEVKPENLLKAKDMVKKTAKDLENTLGKKELDEKAVNPYAIGMAQAMKSTGDKPPLKKSTITKAHDIAKSIKKKTDEAEIPSSGPDYGAGLGAGRKDNVLEAKPDFLDLDKDGNKKESMKKAAADKKKKKVDEAMNTLEAAYHEGKSHGLSKHGYACRYNEGSEEHKRYHDGFKEGLDECYGLMPNRGLVGETMPAATVPGMASQAMPAMEAEMDEGNAFTAALAKADKGEKFTVGGKTFTDRSNYDAKIDEFAFESLNKQLDELLNEGVSVNMSQGLNDGMGGQGGDSVSVTATDDDAAKLLDFIKQVGLGGLGAAAAEKEVVGGAEPIAAVSDYGAPKFSGHDDMKALVAKVDDYKDEEGHGDAPKMKMCGVHKLPEGQCACGEGKEMVDEVETEDQLTYQVAEDDGEGYEQSQAAAAEIDSALAGAQGGKDVQVSEGGDGGEASEESDKTTSGDAGEGGAEDVSDEQEKLDEWANDAGKDGTDQAFERDIDFMTKIISGGLNKPKSTGQTTIPVIAGQEARMGDEDVTAWKRLAGLIK